MNENNEDAVITTTTPPELEAVDLYDLQTLGYSYEYRIEEI